MKIGGRENHENAVVTAARVPSIPTRELERSQGKSHSEGSLAHDCHWITLSDSGPTFRKTFAYRFLRCLPESSGYLFGEAR